MRGDDRQPTAMFSYVSAEDRVPADHPLRPIRALVDEILRDMSRDFDGLYARVGRPSIPPERLLMEQLDYNILLRWFVGLEMDEPIWDTDRVHHEPRSPAESGGRAPVPGAGRRSRRRVDV